MLFQLFFCSYMVALLAASTGTLQPEENLKERLALFQRLLDYIYVGDRPPNSYLYEHEGRVVLATYTMEDAENALEEFRYDSEVLGAFTNFKLFRRILDYFTSYLVNVSMGHYDKAIEFTLLCPNLEVSRIDCILLHKADKWLPEKTKELFWNRLVLNESHFNGSIYYSQHVAMDCTFFCKLLVRGYHTVPELSWLKMLNFQVARKFVSPKDKRELLLSVAPLLISNFTTFEQKMASAEAQCFHKLHEFILLPIYKAFRWCWLLDSFLILWGRHER